MSEVTQAYSQTPTPDSGKNSPATQNTGANLAPVCVCPSRYLWLLQIAVFSLMLVFACVALWPFLFTAFYWPIALFIFTSCVLYALRQARRVYVAQPKSLSVINNVWRLRDHTGEHQVEPVAEILLWDYVIVIPLRGILTGKKTYLVALIDSMDAEEWRKLRVWLRTCLDKTL